MTNQKNTTPDPTFLPPESEKRKAFLAHARHELRTPLNHIIGYSEMLLEDAEDQSLAGFIPDLAMIGRTARQMLRLINEKLDDSQISADMAPSSAEIGSP